MNGMWWMRRMRKAGWLAGITMLMMPAWVVAQALCQNDKAPIPTIGVGMFHCQGGTCVVRGSIATMGRSLSETGQPTGVEVRGRVSQDPRRPAFDFSVQPWLWRVDPDGPAVGIIEDGDRLLAINGAAITSSAAGRILGDMQPGDLMEVAVRRGSEVHDLEVTVGETCSGISVSVGPTRGPFPIARGIGVSAPTPPDVWVTDSVLPPVPAPPGVSVGVVIPPRVVRSTPVTADRVPVARGSGVSVGRAVAPSPTAVPAERAAPVADAVDIPNPRVVPGTLGIGIECSECTLRTGSGERRWSFSDYPIVLQVERGGAADEGGLQAGDVLTHINGLDLKTPEGAERFSTLMAGEQALVRYQRGGEEGVATVTVRPRR